MISLLSDRTSPRRINNGSAHYAYGVKWPAPSVGWSARIRESSHTWPSGSWGVWWRGGKSSPPSWAFRGSARGRWRAHPPGADWARRDRRRGGDGYCQSCCKGEPSALLPMPRVKPKSLDPPYPICQASSDDVSASWKQDWKTGSYEAALAPDKTGISLLRNPSMTNSWLQICKFAESSLILLSRVQEMEPMPLICIAADLCIHWDFRVNIDFILKY
jgi:hypothetical protein